MTTAENGTGTALTDANTPYTIAPQSTEDVPYPRPPRSVTRPIRSLNPRRAAVALGAWVIVTLASLAVVVYGLGPLFQQRDQRTLLSTYRTAVYDASNATPGLGSVAAPTLPPAPGTPVGILEIGALRLQQVVIEGVSPSQTERGPGHVPGTAGLGQPGNAAVVARRSGFGGPFSGLSRLRQGDRILVTTTQGQSVYQVTQVAATRLYPGAVTPSATSSASGLTNSFTQTTSTTAPTAPAKIGPAVAVDDLYGPSTTNRLTLVTSASALPWNTRRATVVLAKLIGEPFAATPQESRSDAATGNNGSAGAWTPVALLLLGYLAAAFAAVLLYRRVGWRSAYLVTIAPLVALVVLLAEFGAQLLPAWL